MTTYYGLTELKDVDLFDMQLEARHCGLQTPGPITQACETFDNLYDGRPVRKFGRIDFDKTTRLWTAQACAGASPEEVATLLWHGSRRVRRHGDKPGQGLRDPMWRHVDGKNSHRYACMFLVRYVDKSELLEFTLSEALDDILTGEAHASGGTAVPRQIEVSA